jgi:ABC-2 type transport system permease protein
MIKSILWSHWLHVKRDYVALGLTFVLPIVFFTIFAAIFSGMGGGGDDGGLEPMDILVVDEDRTEVSQRFLSTLGEQEALQVHTAPGPTDENPDPEIYTRETARQQVRSGNFSAAVVIPKGFSQSYGEFTETGEPVEIIYDAANPFAQHLVGGLIQATAFQAAPDILMKKGMGYLEEYGGGLTQSQQEAVDAITPYLRGDSPWEELSEEESGESDSAPADVAAGSDLSGLVQIKATDARAGQELEEEEDETRVSMVAYYAAGIGVMFLLFSMAGAGGSLLDEEESGALERVLTSNTSMTTLLLGKWIFFGLMGLLQVILMFAWGAFVFGLDLFTTNHFVGFLAMTIVTAAAASGFGLVLASACRSRAQLGGISTIVILIMSALGGSMVPRFVMPDFMNTTALFTFNGWALDGYLKVFWYDDPAASLGRAVVSLLPQLLVLSAAAVVFLLAARLIARRWETV